MKTCELFKKKTTLSFEVFPPKSSTPVESIYSTISQLQPLNPDFISVTYGAGGSTNNATIDICSAIKNHHKIESDRKSTRLNSSHKHRSRMPSSA